MTGASYCSGYGHGYDPTNAQVRNHAGGMLIDVDTPSTEDGTKPFYATIPISGTLYIAANDEQHIAVCDPNYHCRPEPASTSVPVGAVAHTYSVQFQNWRLLDGVREYLIDPPRYNDGTRYSVADVRAQLLAFATFAGHPPVSGGAMVRNILYNDPRTHDIGPPNPPFVIYVQKHGGHFHVQSQAACRTDTLNRHAHTNRSSQPGDRLPEIRLY